MFDPIQIPVWGNVNLVTGVDVYNTEKPIAPGHIYIPLNNETEACPVEIYRVDVKAIRVRGRNSIYDDFIAYYYEASGISPNANNKLCLVREIKTKYYYGEKFVDHRYYFGIYQIYGTKRRVINPDPTSKFKVIADDVNPDLVAPIILFSKAEALTADKIITKDIKDIPRLLKLIIEEQSNRIKLDRQKKHILSAADKVDKARKDTDENYKKSETILKSLSEKQKELDVKLQSFLTKIYYDEQKKDAEKTRIKSSFLGGLVPLKEEPAEVDYETPSLLQEKKTEEISLDDLGYIENTEQNLVQELDNLFAIPGHKDGPEILDDIDVLIEKYGFAPEIKKKIERRMGR